MRQLDFHSICSLTHRSQLPIASVPLQVYIPSDKAYGASGSGAKIGPNATLVFKIELLEIIGKKDPKAKKGKADKEL